MSSTATETNGTTTNRMRGTVPATKFQRLYALAAKGAERKFTLKRQTDEGSVTLRCDGFPATLDVQGVTKLAQDNGGKTNGTTPIGEAGGQFRSTVIGSLASEMVKEMTQE
jgi:hypothetical protein